VRAAEHVPDAAECLLADRHRDRLARVEHVDAAGEAVGRVHRHRADAVVAQMLLHLCDQRARARAVLAPNLELEGGVDLRQAAGEHDVEHDALDLDDLADVRVRLLLGHESPEKVWILRQAGASRAGA